MATRSTGDVFRDLGFSEQESEDLRLRSDLMIELKRQLDALGESQADVAARLGISQPRVSNLMRGRIDLFSLDSLVVLLGRLGSRVTIAVRPESANVCIAERLSTSWSPATFDESFTVTAAEAPVHSAVDTQLALAA